MKKSIIVLVYLANLFCAYAQEEIFGLASPIQLEMDTTTIMLEDYFMDVSAIENIQCPLFLTKQLSADKKILTLVSTQNEEPFLSNLIVTTSVSRYALLLRKSKKQNIQFSFEPKGDIYGKVSLVGDLTGWDPNRIFLQLNNGKWQTQLALNPGRYQYQIVVDGKWILDSNNLDSIDNGIGGYNSLLTINAPAKNDLPTISTKSFSTANNSININTHNTSSNQLFCFWNNTPIALQNFTLNGQANDGIATFGIPAQAIEIKRSLLRVYAFNAFGEANDLLIPLEFGKVITEATALESDDFQKTIMYFLLVDRFKNGDATNDEPIQNALVLPQANYYGGDLQGVHQKIDDGYFTNLGFNTIWISPVFQNPYTAYQEFPEPHRWFSGYHGYWPISLSKVDTRFGTNALFKNLVDNAHQNNLSVYLDYVANHIHAEHPLWQQQPTWFSKLNLQDGRKNLRLWDEYRLTTWFEPYMPSFDHSQTIVAEACADSAMFWLKTFNLDGFRHDATKHIETEFWRLLTKKIKTEVEIPQQKNIYQIGESFGSRALIGSYLGSGLLNAQFDFNLYFDARSVFAQSHVSFKRLSASLQETFDYYGYHHVMGNITGNHDIARFISYASGDLLFTDNDKEIGWHKTIEVTDTIGYARLKMLHAFNMTIPGVPIVYQGDEFGEAGAGDPDNRRMMRFDGLNAHELKVKNTVKQLAKLRSLNMALLYGDFVEMLLTDSTFMFSRNYFGNHAVVVFNKSTKPITIQFPLANNTDFGSLQIHFNNLGAYQAYTINLGSDPGIYNGYQLTVAAHSFEIITFNTQ